MRSRKPGRRVRKCLLHGFVLVWVLLPAVIGATSDRRSFRQYSIADGLSVNSVFSIAQDHRGFIWIGTEDGLNRFDGHSFKVYRADPTDSTSLLSGLVSALYLDRSGVLWVGTFRGGLQRYDPNTDSFITVRREEESGGILSLSSIWSITEDRWSNLWIGTRSEGLTKLGPSRRHFSQFRHDPDDPGSLSSDRVLTVFEDSAGFIWIGTEGQGLNRFDPEKEQFTRFVPDPSDPASLIHGTVAAVFEDSRNRLWVGGGGLDLLDRTNGSFSHFPSVPDDPRTLSGGAVYSIIEDETGALWMGAFGSGLNRFDPETGIFTRHRMDSTDPQGLSNDNVYTLFVDATGILWIGTVGGGLNTLDLKAKHFGHIRSQPNDPNSLSDKWISALATGRSGGLWVGTLNGGLDRVDRHHRVVARHRHDPEDPTSLADDTVWAVLEDSSGRVWVGTRRGGLQRLDPETGTFSRPPAGPDARSALSLGVRYFAEDHFDNLWVGTIGAGLLRRDPESGEFAIYQPSPEDDRSISDVDIDAIYEDRNGEMWIGSLGGGLNLYDRESDSFTRFRHRPGDPTSLSDDRVRWIMEDHAGTLWVGTMGGLNRLDRSAMTFSARTIHDGLPNNVVWAILEDDRGSLWLSTNQGMSCYNPKTDEFRNYDVHDGLQSDEFNASAAALGAGSEMFFGGVNGITVFFPEQIQDNPIPPSTAIVGLSLFSRPVIHGQEVDGRILLNVPITEVTDLKLSYQDKVVTFEFAALHFALPERNRFAYRLEGFEHEWNEVGDRRFATYTSLPAGDYVFRVKSSNADGVWDEAGTALRVIVAPPIWATWWFRGLILASFLGASFIAHRSRMIGIQKRASQLEEFNQQLHRQIAVRERAEKALRHSEERYRDLYDNAVEGVFEASSDGSILRANPALARVMGYESPRQFESATRDIGTQHYRNPQTRSKFIDLIREEGVVNGYEAELRRKDGSTIWAAISARGIFDAEGTLLKVHGFLEDVSARKRANQERELLIAELESQNVELERFTYTVSHDLKSPLITIQGFMGMIRESAVSGDFERLDEDVARISAAVEKMGTLLDELLDLSRVGRVVNPSEEISVIALIEDAIDTHRSQIEEYGVEFVVEENLPTIFGDRIRLREVFENLIGNAIKFSGSRTPPKIEVGLREDGSKRVFFVKDNGIGIEPRYHDKVFGLFEQLDPTVPGSGIGLAIVKRIVEVFGGELWIESVGTGGGTVLCFTLPETWRRPVSPMAARES